MLAEHLNPAAQKFQSDSVSANTPGCSCATLCPDHEGIPDTSVHTDKPNHIPPTVSRPCGAAGLRPSSSAGVGQSSSASARPSITASGGRPEIFGSPQSQHVYRGFEPAASDGGFESDLAIQIRRELPPSPTSGSRRSSCGAIGDEIDGEYLDKASPLACRSPKVYNYPSPLLLPQQASSESEALPECKQRKYLSWLWKSTPDHDTDQPGIEATAGGIVRRASESAMGIISAYADAHTVCRRVSAMPTPIELTSSCRLDPCHETDEPTDGPA